MSKRSLPAFTAEASLYVTCVRYRTTAFHGAAEAVLQPALTWCTECEVAKKVCVRNIARFARTVRSRTVAPTSPKSAIRRNAEKVDAGCPTHSRFSNEWEVGHLRSRWRANWKEHEAELSHPTKRRLEHALSGVEGWGTRQVDVTDKLPFLVTKLSPYYNR
jgi:hypothetical protein